MTTGRSSHEEGQAGRVPQKIGDPQNLEEA